MIKVVPAIIPESKSQMLEEIEKVSKFANLIQIDISDGIFTPYKTWPYNAKDSQYFENLKTEIEGLPYWDTIDYEFHLMVENPDEILETFIHIGASGIIVQVETITDFEEIYTLCKENEVSLGLAIKPKTDIEKLVPFVEKIDFIQVMGSDQLGKHGTELEEIAIEKIKELRKLYPEKEIAIDIGVNEETKEELVSAGATKLISGGAILNSPNPQQVYSELSQ